MPDFRVDETAPEHLKMRAAGPAAIGLWAMAGAYCMRSDVLSDGWVPDHFVMSWPSGKRLAGVLVKVGLWVKETRDSAPGYQFHDWLSYQRSRSKVETDRDAARQRMRAIRSPDVRANKPRTTSEVRPKFNDSLTHTLTHTPIGHLGEGNSPGVARENANPHPQRPPEHCDKHPGGTSTPCGRCADARRAAEQWDTDDAKRAELIAAELEQVRADPRNRCAHGTDGGSYPHPQTGEPLCALCRHAERTSA